MAMDPTFTNTDRTGSLTGAHDTGLYDPNMHDNQIVAMYDTIAHANSARDKLVAAGVSASSIQIVDQSTMGTGASTTTTATTQDEGLWGSIKSLFAPDDDLHGYAEGVHRGHAVLTVAPSGTVDRSHIIQVLESTDPIDFDAKLEEWRQTGYTNPASATIGAATGMATGAVMDARSPTLTGTRATTDTVSTISAAPLTTGATVPPMRTTGMDATLGDADTIKVMEERLRVGKREVAMGGVRVRSYVVERPVEEQVRLHEERVTLERHPVDRAVTAADEAGFRERTIEMRATGEEAIVAKEARVVEEIGIRKEASDRTETVRDTVRRTEVEIDDTLTGTVATGATSVKGASVTGASVTGAGVVGSSVTGGSTTTSTPGAATSGSNAPRK